MPAMFRSAPASPGSRPAIVFCSAAANCGALRLARTTSIVWYRCSAVIGKNIAGCCSSVSVRYFPSCTTPTTLNSALASPAGNGRQWHCRLNRRPCARRFLHDGYFGTLRIVVPGEIAAGEQRRLSRAEIARRNLIVNRVGRPNSQSGNRSFRSHTQTCPNKLTLSGAKLMYPAAYTPGIRWTDSSARAETAPHSSSLYPALCRSNLASIAPSGENPKLLCSDRTKPRSATSDEVTSTAHTAICTTSSTSRSVSLRHTRAADSLPLSPADRCRREIPDGWGNAE